MPFMPAMRIFNTPFLASCDTKEYPRLLPAKRQRARRCPNVPQFGSVIPPSICHAMLICRIEIVEIAPKMSTGAFCAS